MARIVLTSRLPEGVPSWRTWLAGHEVREPEADAWPRARWLAEAADADALVCLLGDRIDAEVIAAAPRLRVIANYAVGYDNVDVAAAATAGVVVTNTPDVLTEATADFTWALILATARRLGEGERLVRAGAWSGWAPTQLLGIELGGRTLGLVGYGRIGRAVARRARGFGMAVIAADSRPGRRGGDDDVAWVELDELYARADVVSLHCPLTPATRGLVDAGALARMRPGAILINTARGACVDEGALADALTVGHLGGAGLDVFAAEPTIDPRLRAAPRTVLAPHLGSATTTARVRMAELCISAVVDVLAGRVPPNRVGAVAGADRGGA
ncbi:MAG: D-glycerate dehydrogenase [Myxococcales bacterium]|nr:D-glycerate dehydrogenase [Myxococcales bacterium]